ncbi:MAG: alanine racemase, partial [Desulfosalsimonas sp.]
MIPYDLWAEIDLGAIEHNVGALKSCLSRGTGLMAVVKADGYGHGARQSALAALRAGADCLAVARLGEALELRNAGIDCPVLIFGRTRPELIHKLLHYDLIQSVFSRDYALCLSSGARAAGRRLRVHVNVDTGMGRLGVLGVPAAGGSTGVKDAADAIEAVCGLEGLAAEGIYTHFATADERDKTRARRQLEL